MPLSAMFAVGKAAHPDHVEPAREERGAQDAAPRPPAGVVPHRVRAHGVAHHDHEAAQREQRDNGADGAAWRVEVAVDKREHGRRDQQKSERQFAGEQRVPVTMCPCSMSCGTNWTPTAPLARATELRIVPPRVFGQTGRYEAEIWRASPGSGHSGWSLRRRAAARKCRQRAADSALRDQTRLAGAVDSLGTVGNAELAQHVADVPQRRDHVDDLGEIRPEEPCVSGPG